MKSGTAEELRALADRLEPGEPVFCLRGRDVLAPAGVEAYGNLLDACTDAIASVDTPAAIAASEQLAEMVVGVRAFADRMREWQRHNGERVKLPD